MDENVRSRIFSAADELYEANGRTGAPTVSEVRKLAKVDMNEACEAMREWRRRLGQKVSTLAATPLPPELRDAALAVFASFWQQSSRLSNESLLTAQAAWEAERQLNEDLCQQVTDDYDAQSAELSCAKQELGQMTALLQQKAGELQTLRDELTRACQERDNAQRGLSDTMARLSEARRRAEDLEKAASYAREETNRTLGQLEALRTSQSEQMEKARAEFRNELESERTRFERERQRYEERANSATVEAATLRGRLENMETAHREASTPPAGRSRRKPNGGAKQGGAT